MTNERGEKFTGPGLEPGSSLQRTDALPAEPPGQAGQIFFTLMIFQ